MQSQERVHRNCIAGLSLHISYLGSPTSISISYALTVHDGPVVMLPEVEARKIGASLKRWSERPVAQANARAMGLCAVAVVLVMVAALQSPDPIPTIRGIAIMFITVQCAVHYNSIASLRALIGLGVREASIGLAAYRDPRRVSCLDMAMMWTAVALLARYFQ